MNFFNTCGCSTSDSSLEPPSLIKQRQKSKPQCSEPKKIHDAPLQIQEIAPQVPVKRQKSRLRSRLVPVDPHSIVLAGLLRTACESNIQVQPLQRQSNYHREEAINDLKNRQTYELTESAYSFCCAMTENFVVDGRLDVSLADITHAIPEIQENDDWMSFQKLVGCTDRNQFLWLLRAYKASLVDWSEKLPTVLIEEIVYSLDLRSAFNARLANRRASNAIMFHENSNTLRLFAEKELGYEYTELLSESERVLSGRSSTDMPVLRFFGGIQKLFIEPHARIHLSQIIWTNLAGHRELTYHLWKKYEQTDPFVIFRELKDFNNDLREKVGEKKMEEFQYQSQDVILAGIFLYWTNRFDLLEKILEKIALAPKRDDKLDELKELNEFMFHMLADMTVVFPEDTVGKYWLMFLRGDEIFPASEYLYKDFDDCAMYSKKVMNALQRNFSIRSVPCYSKNDDYQSRERRVAWLGHCIMSDWSKFPWSSDNALHREVGKYVHEEKWSELVTLMLEK